MYIERAQIKLCGQARQPLLLKKQLCVPQSRLHSATRSNRNSFLIPMNRLIPDSIPNPTDFFFGVARATHTTLDVLQEGRIDDYWNIDGARDLTDSWTGTVFSLTVQRIILASVCG